MAAGFSPDSTAVSYFAPYASSMSVSSMNASRSTGSVSTPIDFRNGTSCSRAATWSGLIVVSKVETPLRPL